MSKLQKIKEELELSFKKRYGNLNSAQKKAVDTIEGPLLVVAGPGSGKTEILSLRVANILLKTHALPQNILCMTFTESASYNMRERLSKLIGHEAYKVGIHTFHDFCLNIIQKYPEYFYKGAYFKPADPLSAKAILEKIISELPIHNPLRSEHPEQGYTYIKDIERTIVNLKKAGITPSEFKLIIEHNKESIKKAERIIVPALSGRIGPNTYNLVSEAIKKLDEEIKNEEPFPNILFKSVLESLSITLGRALQVDFERKENRGVDKKQGLSNWKLKHLEKLEDDSYVLKDTMYFDKWDTLQSIYEKYRQEMYKHALFDFDDMILDVISAVETHSRLKIELAEQYHYVLVDEFQDTNMAQMKLVMLLVDNPVNENRPNIMVVGDDDQAVYKFQGAELSNILNFRQLYSDVELVTMTSNYRSTQDILDVATHIIRKGEERLENIVPALEKSLKSANKDIEKGNIHNLKFETVLHEYHYVSKKVKELIEQGADPESIAIIARKHISLVSIVPFLKTNSVPIRYEREQSVLEEPHIEQLIILSQFIETLNNKGSLEADEYLPKILAFPFWNIDRKDIWQLSHDAYKENITWLQVMEKSDNRKIKEVYNFLLEAGRLSKYEPLEKVLDYLIGAHMPLSRDNEDDEEEEFKPFAFSSPFKNYYFNPYKFSHNRAEYLSFLSSLRVFIQSLKDYVGGDYGNRRALNIDDLVCFVDLRKRNDIPLNDESPFASSNKAVNLMTAHRAKGLEFDTVFVLSCNDNIWAGRGFPKKLRLPLNLPIEPAGDTFDDQLRLFYVAITRAKRNLYLTSYTSDSEGSKAEVLRFLLPDSNTSIDEKTYNHVYNINEIKSEEEPNTTDLLTSSWLNYHTPPFLGEEKELLKTLLKNYQLSVTHLNNFLNVGKGGPQYFLENNLLRFPQSKTVSGSYGTAVHKTLERYVIAIKAGEMGVNKEIFLQWFKEALLMERLSKKDFEDYLAKGIKALSIYFDERSSTFNSNDLVEVNFRNSGIVVTNKENLGVPAHITGKIDRIIVKDNNRCDVLDYKTGKPRLSWEGKGDDKERLYEYRRQLMFYKILTDEEGKYKLDKAILEFVEPYETNLKGDDNLIVNSRIIDLTIDFNQTEFEDGTNIQEEMDRLRKLICIVYKKIMDLDFPQVSRFDKNLKGQREFEDFLLTS